MRPSSRAGAAEAQGAADTKHEGRRVRAAAAEGKWGAERRWRREMGEAWAIPGTAGGARGRVPSRGGRLQDAPMTLLSWHDTPAVSSHGETTRILQNDSV